MTDHSQTVFGGPTKRFFVEMLTRDIDLKDAILDLIDNSVDGAIRQNKKKLKHKRPFDGFEARLTVREDKFEISDNCGGIPEDQLDSAFSLGRPKLEIDAGLPTIGMYGIGMKRAIFKIGRESTVESRAKDAEFSVAYDSAWMDPSNNDWDLPITRLKQSDKDYGVTIKIPRLRKQIARLFASTSFVSELKTAISDHFGYLMQKGFSVVVNGSKVEPSTLHLFTSSAPKGAIRPYDFEVDEDDVQIRVTVGFFRTLVEDEEIDEEALDSHDQNAAGVTVVCNDRVVLLRDTSMRTGWGDGGVPKFHPQFRGIAGLIAFSTEQPLKLPISTTKRDLDVGADIYLLARRYCMEGLRECTAFTNKWKGMEAETKSFFDASQKRDVRTEVRLATEQGKSIRDHKSAKKASADLPVPEERNPRQRISFTKTEREVRAVSRFLFEDAGQKPSVVGEECFNKILKMARPK